MGAAILATHQPGVFLIDECNYLAGVIGLGQGRLSLPNTAGLSSTRELFYFDPVAKARQDLSTPVSSTAPPLYAPLALPFSTLGWTGLVALNTLSFLLCAVLVFSYTASYARAPFTPILAAVFFLLGTYSIEYAQGMWPHMLSMLLVMGGFVLSARVRQGAPLRWAILGGLVSGMSIGIRYPNLVISMAVGAGLLLWSRRGLGPGALYALGHSVPLACCSVLNYLSHGWWNPVSKGAYYFNFVSGENRGISAVRDPFWILWAKVVDFASHPPVGFMMRHPKTGMYLLRYALKKAWAQSSPWVLLALTALGLAWRGDQRPLDPQRTELRAISLVVASLLGLYAMVGFDRTDGFCYNQRYFIDLFPFVAVALAWATEGMPLPHRHLASGVVLGLPLVLSPYLLDRTSLIRHLALLRLPLVVAGLLVLCWLLGRRGSPAPRLARLGLPMLLGVCLTWSAVVHLADDVNGSHHVRARWLESRLNVEGVIRSHERLAVLGHFPSVVSLCSLWMDYDIVIADTTLDNGHNARDLAHELLDEGRRVLLYTDRFYPPRLIERIVKGLTTLKLFEKDGVNVLQLVR